MPLTRVFSVLPALVLTHYCFKFAWPLCPTLIGVFTSVFLLQSAHLWATPKCLSKTHDPPRHGVTWPAGDPRQVDHHPYFPDEAKTPMQPSHKNKTGWNFLHLSFLFWNYSSLTPGYAGFSPPETGVSTDSCSLPFSLLLLKTDLPSISKPHPSRNAH